VVLLDTSNSRRKTDLSRLAKSSSFAVLGLTSVDTQLLPGGA
jgi:hypothetical protein